MSTSKKEESLLGKKREKSDKDSEEDSSKEPKKKKIKKQSESSENSNSEESSESEDNNQPKKSLFGENEKGFTGGLFGDLDNPEKKTTSLFGNTGGSIFGNVSSGGSLFGNVKSDDKKEGLFSGNLFDFSKINKKEENEEEEGDDNIGKSKSPKHEYNPEKEKETDNKKKYVKKMNDVFLLDKNEKKYISRGEGLLSIESQEIEKDGKKERFVILIYRNTIGGIIFEGVLDSKVNKFDSYEKKLKKVCHIFFLMKDKDNVPSLAQAKIPFTSEEDVKEFEEKYKNAIKYLKNEVEDF